MQELKKMKFDILTKKVMLLIISTFLILQLVISYNSIPVIAQDLSPPTILIVSPGNSIYYSNTVDLNFNLNEAISWIGYSLDGATNQTIQGNVTLSLLSLGSHNLVVYATDLLENTGISNIINFEVSPPPVDTEPPVIEVLSPRDTIYPRRNVDLNFSLSEDVSWMGYSLDGASNATVFSNSSIIWSLADGPHSLIVYAKDELQNTGKSDVINFSVDTRAPTVILWPPGNQTYTTSDIDLVIKLSENASWIGYSLDGASNQTIEGNVTLSSLSEGPHNVVVYASDNLLHTGKSKIVYFSIDTTLPVVSITSPINSTYSVDYVDLKFTVGEEFSSVRYSLDGSYNRTIEGNVILSSLDDGPHNVVVYATDAAYLNTGSSNTINFTVDTTPPVVVLSSPSNDMLYTTNNISLSIKTNEEALLKYSLDGENNITIVDPMVLSNLINGRHYLTIYSKDPYGNIGEPQSITFTVDVEPILKPTEIIAVSLIILGGLSLVIIFGYKNKL